MDLEEWPILTADNMCKGGFQKGKRRCLWGHLYNLGVDTHTIKNFLCDAILEFDPSATTGIQLFNDSHSCEVNAAIWNRAGALMGYTEGNPCAKKVVV
jgi:hypothetical protein